jgi:hypothetical protein
MNAPPDPDPNPAEPVRGPHGWINWYAERLGYPRRTDKHPDTVVIQPTWEEFLLYADAEISGAWLTLGPYEVQSLDPPGPAGIGLARRALLLRAWDHLPDTPSSEVPLATDTADYVGGDIGDELAALLGLALARRVRSGGRVRRGLPGDAHPLGLALESEHHPPVLEPPRHDAMISWLGRPASLPDAEDLLSRYPTLDRADAVALVRAASQYVDGLWYADLDPRVAWLKLVGALEVAANRFDGGHEESDLEQLERHNPEVYAALMRGPIEIAEEVAANLAPTLRVQRKLRAFVKAFDPGPPPERPAPGSQFDWDTLDAAIGVIYKHRSRDLHDGLAFPWVLCEPPHPDAGGPVPPERMFALAVAGRGGQWAAEDLPMYLHVFAHVAGGALRRWWASLGESTPPETPPA